MWIIFALLSLLFLNLRNVVTKFNVSNTHEYISMWYTFIFQFPLGLVAILFSGIEIDESKFFILVLVRVILDIVAFMFFFKALKIAKLSTVLPLMALLPTMTVFTSFFINGQAITIIRLALAIAIAIFCYSIYKSDSNNESTGSNDRIGVIYTLLVIIIYSILDPLHAEIIKLSAPFTYFFISSIYFIIIWSIFVFFNYRKELVDSLSNKKSILFNGANGVILSLEVLSLFSALVPGSITSVVSAIRSTNIATSSLLGGLIFKEKLSKSKIILIFLTLLAVLLLILI